MEVYQVCFDASCIILLVDHSSEIFPILQAEDDNFVQEAGQVYYVFSDDCRAECQIVNISAERGIVQWESH